MWHVRHRLENARLRYVPTLWERFSFQIRQVFRGVSRHGGGRISPGRAVMPQIPPRHGRHGWHLPHVGALLLRRRWRLPPAPALGDRVPAMRAAVPAGAGGRRA
jgi:hypothetical protein